MPASPAMAEQLARQVIEMYAEAERLMIARMARNLARGIEGPEWAALKLSQIREYERQAEALLAGLEKKAQTGVTSAVTKAYERGGLSAVADMAKMGKADAAEPLAGLRATEALAAETLGNVVATHPRILRSTMDAYRSVIAETAQQVLLGTQTRREAAQEALNRFAARGVTGFVDKAGRGWNLQSYVEMAMRTGAGKAAVQGHVDRLTANGLDLVIVSDAPRECPLCLVAGTVVEGPAVEWRCRLEYSGDLISISTASGKHLSGTPDHTILTPNGWRRLKELHPGDEVISDSGQQGYTSVVPDDVQAPALIEEAGELRAPLLLSGPARRDFDRDVAYREVHVVPPNGGLRPEHYAALGKPRRQLEFVGGAKLGALSPSLSDAAKGLLAVVTSAPRLMGRLYHRSALALRGLSPAFAHGGTGHRGPLLWAESVNVRPDATVLRPGGNSSPAEVASDRSPADSESGSSLLRRLAGLVESDEIVGLSISQFAGHVWDLQTGPSWYASNGIISHNCRPWEGKVLSISGADDRYPSLTEARDAGLQHVNCRHSLSAYQEGITRPMTHTADPEGYAATQKLRYLERQTRAAKRLQAAAMDEAARKAAGVKVRGYQTKIRAHVSRTTAKRQPTRERLGAL